MCIFTYVRCLSTHSISYKAITWLGNRSKTVFIVVVASWRWWWSSRLSIYIYMCVFLFHSVCMCANIWNKWTEKSLLPWNNAQLNCIVYKVECSISFSRFSVDRCTMGRRGKRKSGRYAGYACWCRLPMSSKIISLSFIVTHTHKQKHIRTNTSHTHGICEQGKLSRKNTQREGERAEITTILV